MLKHVVALATLGVVFAIPVSAQDARTVIDSAVKAMGDLRTVEFSATGFDFVLGQNYGAATAWPKFINKSYRRWIDFQAPASRVERVRMQGEVPPRGGGQQPVIGEQAQNQVIVVTATTPWVQQLEIWMTPHGFLKAAAANNATAKSQVNRRKEVHRSHFHGAEQSSG